MARSELQTRRMAAARAWSTFVERGDEAEAMVRPEILHSWARSGAAGAGTRPKRSQSRRGFALEGISRRSDEDTRA